MNRFGLNLAAHYFIRYESDEIAWQSRLLTPHLYSTKSIVRTRLSPTGEGFQVMIYTHDQGESYLPKYVIFLPK